MSFWGEMSQPTLSNFTVGVDVVPVPEPGTWVAAALLGIPVLVNGLNVWRKYQMS